LVSAGAHLSGVAGTACSLASLWGGGAAQRPGCDSPLWGKPAEHGAGGADGIPGLGGFGGFVAIAGLLFGSGCPFLFSAAVLDGVCRFAVAAAGACSIVGWGGGIPAGLVSSAVVCGLAGAGSSCSAGFGVVAAAGPDPIGFPGGDLGPELADQQRRCFGFLGLKLIVVSG